MSGIDFHLPIEKEIEEKAPVPEVKQETLPVKAEYSGADLLTEKIGLAPHSPRTYALWQEMQGNKYKDLELTAEEVRQVKIAISRMSHGVFASLPLRCMGELCPQKSECPLFAMGKAPVGKKCLIEMKMIEELYLSFTAQFNVSPESYTELLLIDDLITTEILLKRALNALSDPSIRQKFYTVNKQLDDHEIPFTELQDGTIMRMIDTEYGKMHEINIHPLLVQAERLMGKKASLLTKLVATPQERYKRDSALKVRSNEDTANNLPKAREKINDLLTNTTVDTLQEKYLA